MEANAAARMGHSDTLSATFGIGARICGAARREAGSAIFADLAKSRPNARTKGNAKQRDASSKPVEGFRYRGGTECAEELQDSCGTSVVGGRCRGFKVDAHVGRSIIAATWQWSGLSLCACESIAARSVNEVTSLHWLYSESDVKQDLI